MWKFLQGAWRTYIFLTMVTIFWIVIAGTWASTRKLHAAEPVRSWDIWNDGKMKVYKVQDGNCLLYITRGYENGFGGGAAVAMVVAPGCRP